MPNNIEDIVTQLNENPEFQAWAVRCAIIHTLFSPKDNASSISGNNISNYAKSLANKAFGREHRFPDITQCLENTVKKQLKLNCQQYIDDLSKTIELNDMIHYSVLQYTGKSVKHQKGLTISQSADKLLGELASMKNPMRQLIGGMVSTEPAEGDDDYNVFEGLIKNYKQTHSKSLLADWLLNIDLLSAHTVIILSLNLMVTVAIPMAANLGLVSASFAIAAIGICLALVGITAIAVCCGGNTDKVASLLRQYLRNEAQLSNDDKMLVREEATLSSKDSKGLSQKGERLPSITPKKVEGLVQDEPIISDSTAEPMVRGMAPPSSNSNIKQKAPVVIPAMQVMIPSSNSARSKFKSKKKIQAAQNQSIDNTPSSNSPDFIQVGEKQYRRIIEGKATKHPRYIHIPPSLFTCPRNMNVESHKQYTALFNAPKMITQQRGANGIKAVKTSKIKANGPSMFFKAAKTAAHIRVPIVAKGKSAEGFPIYEAQGFTKS